MNVFVTDHPMVSEPRSHPRVRKRFLRFILSYAFWLLLLGPYWAIEERGILGVVPDRVRRMAYLPAAVFRINRNLYAAYYAYLNWWYEDPNPPETTR